MSYYTVELGHILHVSPDQVGELTPSVMLDACQVFDALYRSGD